MVKQWPDYRKARYPDRPTLEKPPWFKECGNIIACAIKSGLIKRLGCNHPRPTEPPQSGIVTVRHGSIRLRERNSVNIRNGLRTWSTVDEETGEHTLTTATDGSVEINKHGFTASAASMAIPNRDDVRGSKENIIEMERVGAIGTHEFILDPSSHETELEALKQVATNIRSVTAYWLNVIDSESAMKRFNSIYPRLSLSPLRYIKLSARGAIEPLLFALVHNNKVRKALGSQDLVVKMLHQSSHLTSKDKEKVSDQDYWCVTANEMVDHLASVARKFEPEHRESLVHEQQSAVHWGRFKLNGGTSQAISTILSRLQLGCASKSDSTIGFLARFENQLESSSLEYTLGVFATEASYAAVMKMLTGEYITSYAKQLMDPTNDRLRAAHTETVTIQQNDTLSKYKKRNPGVLEMKEVRDKPGTFNILKGSCGACHKMGWPNACERADETHLLRCSSTAPIIAKHICRVMHVALAVMSNQLRTSQLTAEAQDGVYTKILRWTLGSCFRLVMPRRKRCTIPSTKRRNGS